MKLKTSYLPYILIVLWLVLTVSLTIWWMFNGIHLSYSLQAQIAATSPNTINAIGLDDKIKRMYIWEGGFLVSVIGAGGLALFYYVYSDTKRTSALRSFFAAFTHELKTSLTSMRLQAEILDEDPNNRENLNLRRLLGDIVRLDLQLENALIIARADKSALFIEQLNLAKTVEGLKIHWPNLNIEVPQNAIIHGDKRAVECIIKNVFQNAVAHGAATQIALRVEEKDGTLSIWFKDNGKGCKNTSHLGQEMQRHSSTSGAGVGLFLSTTLAKQMGGACFFSSAPGQSFTFLLQIPGKAV